MMQFCIYNSIYYRKKIYTCLILTKNIGYDERKYFFFNKNTLQNSFKSKQDLLFHYLFSKIDLPRLTETYIFIKQTTLNP